jgi:hypothetical protein
VAWLFGRSSSPDPGRSAPESDPDVENELPMEAADLVIPRLLPLAPGDAERITAALQTLAANGVDVDDIGSLGAAFDRAFAAWSGQRAGRREDHGRMVERFGLGLAEHLTRITDLTWGRVSDAFGTEVGVGAQQDGELLVPTNLVAVRWMNGETGWLPDVVATIVRRRGGRVVRR